MLEEVSRPVLPPSLWPLSVPSIPHKIAGMDLRSLLMHRETNWGLFRREPALDGDVLKRVLEFIAYGVQYKSDLYPYRVALPSLRIALIAQNVKSLERGVYDYRFADAQLSRRNDWASRSPAQPIYSMMNHNIDQVSAILVVIGRLDAILTTLGGRGIRLMNAEAGMAAQRAYIASSALSIGCGAALGFDAHRISEILHLDENAEIPLLLLFIGHRCNEASAYDFALC
jgi:SagB-type dehydrogenase family enzyme